MSKPLKYFYGNMDKQKIKEQEDKLKELAKKSPEKVRKAIEEKVKGLNKPFNK